MNPPENEEQSMSDLDELMSKAFDKASAEPDEPEEPAPYEDTESEAEEPAEPETGEEGGVAPEDEPAIAAPATWSTESKEAFTQLPRELQKVVAEQEKSRDRHFHQRNNELSSVKQIAEQFEQAIGPYKDMIAAEGGTPITAVQNLLQTAASLRRDPQGTIRQLATQFGVSLGGNGQQDQLYLQAMQRVSALENQIRQQELTKRQQQDSEISEGILSFQNEVDASGQPLHPHFESVREEMAALLAAERAKTLQDAYEMAVWARPDIRTILLQQQQAAASRQQSEKAAKAKAASGVRVKGADGLPAKGESKSMDDLMSEAYDKAVGAI
ncbi:hypothetical protein JN531_001370 [Flagellatimonas centrodinii]|uniref:hypothetical protein n=1 Tax=Flagellatimonas centrodinii TaxID=2806210 RepID=UPI001FF07C96|nr:hypothetical protein [Flagellatimonas centrodinii]ULQ46948.1 hypothetical protein JN531_001370 [Flagellatimonas centrodinii]